MIEHLPEEPWSDEVCRSWIEQEITRTGSEVIEAASMPPAVLVFVKGLVQEQYFEPETDDRATKWAKTNLLARTRIIDVDFVSSDR